MSLLKVFEQYRKIIFSERDKGERFERLMYALQTDHYPVVEEAAKGAMA